MNKVEVQLHMETVETKDDFKLPTFVKIGEPTEEDEKCAAEALTAVEIGKSSTKDGRVCHTSADRWSKIIAKSGLGKQRWSVQVPCAVGVAKPLSMFMETYRTKQVSLKIEFHFRPRITT